MPNDEYNDEHDDSEHDLPQRWQRGAPRSLLARGSRVVRERMWDEEAGEWREVIKFSRRKIGDQEKGVFLEEYAKWGRLADGAAKIGVSPETVKAEMKRDKDFAEAVMLAEESYRDKLISHHQDLLFNGTTKETFDRNGQLVSREQIYPIPLIQMELKKHDAGYRDRQEVEVKVTGGVLLAPASVGSIDDWEKNFGIMKNITPPETDADSEGD